MYKLSIATSYTNPEKRIDPWKEALACYEDLADEVVRSGENWPYEFTWDHIGKVFNESYQKATGDWVIRMDLDYFFHEKDFVNELHVNESERYYHRDSNLQSINSLLPIDMH